MNEEVEAEPDLSPVVAVVRTVSDDDILGILVGVSETALKLEHPYFAIVNHTTGNMALVPYCVLSNETFYDFAKHNLKFIVVANEDIAKKYMEVVTAAKFHLSTDPEVLAQQKKDFKTACKAYVTTASNDTVH